MPATSSARKFATLLGRSPLALDRSVACRRRRQVVQGQARGFRFQLGAEHDPEVGPAEQLRPYAAARSRSAGRPLRCLFEMPGECGGPALRYGYRRSFLAWLTKASRRRAAIGCPVRKRCNAGFFHANERSPPMTNKMRVNFADGKSRCPCSGKERGDSRLNCAYSSPLHSEASHQPRNVG